MDYRGFKIRGMFLGKLALAAFVLMLMAVPSAQAQLRGDAPLSVFSQQQPTIQKIEVVGNQRVDESTVLSYIALKPGDPFDAERIDESLKRLFGTQLFADIRIRREESTLVIQVQENPIINRIVFEGNRRIEDDALSAEIQLRPRFVFTRAKVNEDTNRILDIYRRTGRYAAKVEPKIIQLEQNRVNLVFEIEEGDLTYVRRIVFVGNKNFSDSSLRSEINTKEVAWFRVLSTGDTYDPDRVNFDKELLRRFYLENGYADFEVRSVVSEISPDQSGFYITFTLDEGERYKVRNVGIKSELLQDVNIAKLQKLVKIESDDWYDATRVDDTIDLLTDELGNLGYAFVDVDPEIEKDKENQQLDITFVLNEGPKVYVERIDIEGNVRTLDNVIRREFELVEGDAFNTSKLRRSKRNLRNLNYFESIEVDTIPGSEPDRLVIKTEAREKSTGELSFGAGFSTTDSILGNIRLRERNLLGKGQDLRLSATASARRTELDLGFTEPYFMDRKLSAGIDLFRTTVEEDDDSSFRERRVGGGLRLGYQINENLSQQLRYTIREQSIEEVDADASRFIRDQEGTDLTSEISQTLLYDKRDNRIEPSNGYYWRLGTDFAGLGGTVKYLRVSASAGYYYPVAEEWILSLTGEAGLVNPVGGEDINIGDRFFLGGRDLRGFDNAGIGPRDVGTDDALGGNQFAAGTMQLDFPVGLPDELGVTGSIFADAGTLTDIDESGAGIEDSALIRSSVGVGIGWRSPFGPIRIDYAVPITKEDYDEEQSIQFQFGTLF